MYIKFHSSYETIRIFLLTFYLLLMKVHTDKYLENISMFYEF